MLTVSASSNGFRDFEVAQRIKEKNQSGFPIAVIMISMIFHFALSVQHSYKQAMTLATCDRKFAQAERHNSSSTRKFIDRDAAKLSYYIRKYEKGHNPANCLFDLRWAEREWLFTNA